MTRLYNRKCDLGKRKVNGHKFRRQYSLGGFVIDFYSPVLKIAIEVDGGYHLKDDQKIKLISLGAEPLHQQPFTAAR